MDDVSIRCIDSEAAYSEGAVSIDLFWFECKTNKFKQSLTYFFHPLDYSADMPYYCPSAPSLEESSSTSGKYK